MADILSPVLRMLSDRHQYQFKNEIHRSARTVIYDIGGNRVLKITSEKKEAIAASIIKKYLNLKNVVKIFRVFMTNNKHHEKYYIEEERLDKININEDNEAIYEYLIAKQNFDSDFCNDDVKDKLDENSLKIFSTYNDDEKDFICFLYTKNSWNDVNLEFERFHQKFNNSRKQFNDLVNGIKELTSIGIEFYDIHFKNIMKKGTTYKFVDVVWHEQQTKFEILENKNPPLQLTESAVKYATTEKQKQEGLRGIELDDWGGIMVFKNVEEGDTFVGEDCLFDIRIAFLDMNDKVLSIGIIKKDTGRVIAPKGTVKAIETAAKDDYQIIKGEIFKIPAEEKTFSSKVY